MPPEAMISLKPSDFVEGGAVPRDKNLLVVAARFAMWDYQGKAPQTTAAKIDLRDDDGGEYTQYYSVSAPDKFVPSSDGKRLIPVGTAQAVVKSSNFAILIQNLVNAGFPESKIGADIGVLDNLYAYWTGVEPPKRAGLNKDREAAAKEKGFEPIILVPSQILRLPWDKKTNPAKPATKAAPAPAAAAAASTAAATPPAENSDGDNPVLRKAVDFIKSEVNAAGGSITRSKIGAAVFRKLSADPDKEALTEAIFSSETSATLMEEGYMVKGETISKMA